MDLQVGDVVKMRKAHPCGNTDFQIMRTGMDFRIECLKCKHQTWITRVKLERNIKQMVSQVERTPPQG